MSPPFARWFLSFGFFFFLLIDLFEGFYGKKGGVEEGVYDDGCFYFSKRVFVVVWLFISFFSFFLFLLTCLLLVLINYSNLIKNIYFFFFYNLQLLLLWGGV